jgi:ferric-dicitrate binding protein FerR (iron transport regulator)
VRTAWRESARARQHRRWLIIGVPAFAAAAALLLAIVVWRQTPAPETIVARVSAVTGPLRVLRGAAASPMASGDAVRTRDVSATPTGVVAAFRLDGGGEVRQNESTSLRWTSARRLELEDGHIYVDSGDAAGAIEIGTPAGVVRDIGTRFDVRVRAGEVRVRVRDGLVRLESTAGTRDANAGQELLAARGDIEMRSVPPFGDDWDWILRAATFRLDGATLSTFVAWVEAETGRRVEFSPPTLRSEMAPTVLHGSISGLAMADALDTVLTAAGLTHRVDSGRIEIRRQPSGPRP